MTSCATQRKRKKAICPQSVRTVLDDLEFTGTKVIYETTMNKLKVKWFLFLGFIFPEAKTINRKPNSVSVKKSVTSGTIHMYIQLYKLTFVRL